MQNGPIHEAVECGDLDAVRRLLATDAALVDARGMDGARPLHFCRDRGIAELLLTHGAELDARDEDHDSTPAQWRIGDAPDLVRFLLQRGATPDLFLAAALGDRPLARRLMDEDPKCTSYRIGHDSGPFPGIGFAGRGGTIFQWTLGFNRSPHEVALERNHRELFAELLERTPPPKRLLVACMTGDRSAAEALVDSQPNLVADLEREDLELLAKSCWETNKDFEVVRLMLDLGFPVDVPEKNHGFSALHNAAWCGDPDLVELLLSRGHPADLRDPNHQSTAIGWAIHSCLEAKRHPEGRFPETIALLLEAGTPLDRGTFPTGHSGIDAVLARFEST